MPWKRFCPIIVHLSCVLWYVAIFFIFSFLFFFFLGGGGNPSFVVGLMALWGPFSGTALSIFPIFFTILRVKLMAYLEINSICSRFVFYLKVYYINIWIPESNTDPSPCFSTKAKQSMWLMQLPFKNRYWA